MRKGIASLAFVLLVVGCKVGGGLDGCSPPTKFPVAFALSKDESRGISIVGEGRECVPGGLYINPLFCHTLLLATFDFQWNIANLFTVPVTYFQQMGKYSSSKILLTADNSRLIISEPIYVIDMKTKGMQVISSITNTADLVLSPDGSTVLGLSYQNGEFFSLNPKTMNVTKLSLGLYPTTPIFSWEYGGSKFSYPSLIHIVGDKAWFLDPLNKRILSINYKTMVYLQEFPIDNAYYGLDISPDGTMGVAYWPNIFSEGHFHTTTVSLVTFSTSSIKTFAIDVSYDSPMASAILMTDGTILVTTDSLGYVIDPATDTIYQDIRCGDSVYGYYSGYGLARNFDGTKVFNFTRRGTIGSIISKDSCQWDNGLYGYNDPFLFDLPIISRYQDGFYFAQNGFDSNNSRESISFGFYDAITNSRSYTPISVRCQ